MQSLMQPEVVDELNNRFGIDIQSLPSQEQTVLALALTEGLVTNERLRWVLWMHKSDITALLQSLCRKNLLTPEGYGRGTKYSLSHSIVQRPAKKGSSVAKEGSSEANLEGLSADVLKLLSKEKHSRSEMTSLVRELCTHWRTPQELSQSIHKDLKYLKDKVIPMLLENGVLEREYPGIPNHPNQRYRNKQ